MLGSPVAHSLSPVLHGAAYRALGLSDWSYEAIECDEARLPGLLDSLGPDWAGLSLTMPLKRAVLPLLSRREELVIEVGGANTVVFAGGGRDGYNTDVPGLIAALGEAGVTAAEPALVLGAGATACAALGALRGLGAQRVTVAARRPAAARDLRAAAGRLGLAVELVGWEEPGAGPGWSLLISTVTAGAADPYAERIAAGALNVRAVLDVIYHPWPTPLAEAARQAGAATISGFELLLHQAAAQVELMTGRPAPVEAMRAAGRAALSA